MDTKRFRPLPFIAKGWPCAWLACASDRSIGIQRLQGGALIGASADIEDKARTADRRRKTKRRGHAHMESAMCRGIHSKRRGNPRSRERRRTAGDSSERMAGRCTRAGQQEGGKRGKCFLD